MTDISDLREGDEIEAVVRLTCGADVNADNITWRPL